MQSSEERATVAPTTDVSAPDVLVFDIGGTSLRAALYDPRADRLYEVERRATPNFKVLGTCDSGAVRARLCRALGDIAAAVCGSKQPPTIAVGFPGPIDPAGRVLAAPTVWGVARETDPVPLRDDLERLWPGSSITLLNDMTAAGYRYLRHSDEDLCVLTVSSGIGHKVFLAGRPVVGSGGRGGELGHWRVDPSEEAPLCDCGGRGHLGAVSSGRAAAGQVRALAARDPEAFRSSRLASAAASGVERISNDAIVGAFRDGDAFTVRVIERMARPIGRALAAVHLAVGVERYVVLGGFALALGPEFVRRIATAAQASGWELGFDWQAGVQLGEPDDDAGLLGAGRYAARAVDPTEIE
ncbi:MAG: ROK family protein [bacterium]|nr:ROK family protein [bacterium]